MTLLLLYFGLALAISFLCSLMEAVLLCTSHSYIETLIRDSHWSGSMLRRLKEKVDRPLAAILTINTVANTAGAALVGAQALKVAEEMFPASHPGRWVAIVSGVMTICILVFSEIMPKTLGAVYWKRLAPPVSVLISGLIWLVFPIVLVSEKVARLISRNTGPEKVTREEMIASAELTAVAGGLEAQEIQIIRNLLCLNKVRARDVLTPRQVLRAFDQELTIKEVVERHSPLQFSRIPLYGKDLDDITGFVLRYKILGAFSRSEQDKKLASLRQPIFAVPDTKSVGSILEEFVKRREQIFLVVDEYGGTAGIITLEDVIETLLGVEIVDEFDSVADMRKLAMQLGAERRRLLEERLEKAARELQNP